jgi:hypothetical protein
MTDYADLRWDDLRSAIDEEMGPGFFSPAKHRRKATMMQKGMSSRSPPPQAVLQQHQPLRVLSPNTMSPNARSPTMIHAKPVVCIINQQRPLPMLAHNNLPQHHQQKATALAPPIVPFKALGKGCSPEWHVEQQHRRMSQDEGQQQQQQQQPSKQHQPHQPRVIPIKAVARPPCPAETEKQASGVEDVQGVGQVEESTNIVKKPHLHGLMHGGGGGDGGGCGGGGGGGGGGGDGGGGGGGGEDRIHAPPSRAATKRTLVSTRPLIPPRSFVVRDAPDVTLPLLIIADYWESQATSRRRDRQAQQQARCCSCSSSRSSRT